mmetsp:Transcript_33641/g.51883  ORF Transcript_33641/g.51883 Transcript_33641/m.51883 type:complete len:173 (+) Transcript_33641:1516-2034(+)
MEVEDESKQIPGKKNELLPGQPPQSRANKNPALEIALKGRSDIRSISVLPLNTKYFFSKCSPLHLACKKGSQECLELLLRQGANIMAQDERLWTPLHYAAYNGHPAAVNFLLKWEADFDQLQGMLNSQGRSAFMITKNEETKKAFNHIWQACKEGDLDMVRIMIREGQDFNQ